MTKRSAGLLVYRVTGEGVVVLLVHPGGPFWAKREDGAWSIPKGEYQPDEDPHAAAIREFEEELGVEPPSNPPVDLGEVRQAGGKFVRAWAVRGDLDVESIVSNTFEMEWPPRSGRSQIFPEVDRAEWCDSATARCRMIPAQIAFLDALDRLLETEQL